MTQAAQQILTDSENGLCPVCKKSILDCAIIDYQDFHGVQVGVCEEHIKYAK